MNQNPSLNVSPLGAVILGSRWLSGFLTGETMGCLVFVRRPVADFP